MLRECMEREVLAKILLDDDRFFQMFEFIVLDSFDISSDAHRTFRVSLISYLDLKIRLNSEKFPNLHF